MTTLMQQMSEPGSTFCDSCCSLVELVVEDDAEEVDEEAPGSLTLCGSMAKASLVSPATGVNGLISSSASTKRTFSDR